MPEPIKTLAPTPCEWCSTGMFQRKTATVQVQLRGIGHATARLCDDCADELVPPGQLWDREHPRVPLMPVADALPLLEPGLVDAYLAAAEWKNARTAPEYPHAYLLLSRSADPLMHLRVIRWIRHYGARRQWSPADGPAQGKRVWCSYHDTREWTYWTQPSLADPILNRRAA